MDYIIKTNYMSQGFTLEEVLKSGAKQVDTKTGDGLTLEQMFELQTKQPEEVKPIKKKPFIPTLPEKGTLAEMTGTQVTPFGQTKPISQITQEIATTPLPLQPFKAVKEFGSYLFTKATGVKPGDVAREAGNILVQGENIFGTAIGGAAYEILPKEIDIEAERQQTAQMRDKVVEKIKEQQAKGLDTRRLKNLLVQQMSQGNMSDEEINEALKLSNTQIYAGAAQTALDIATAGTFGPATKGMEAFQIGKANPTVLAELQKVKNAYTMLEKFRVGLRLSAEGSALAYGFEQTDRLQRDEHDLKPGLMTYLGAGIPMAGALGKILTKEEKLLKNERIINEVVEDFRSVINPKKGDINRIEVKGKKEVDDILLFMAEEEVIPTRDSSGRLDTVAESSKLKEKKGTVDKLLADNLDDTQAINDLNDVKRQAKKRIDEFEKNADNARRKKEDIDDLINSEIERHGTMVTDRVLHDIKNGMWGVGYDTQRATRSSSARTVGNIMKNAIQDNNINNLNIAELNQLSANYSYATNLLDSVHGSVMPGGVINSWGYRMLVGFGLEKVLANVPGLRIPAMFIGQYIGKHYNEFLNNPERIIGEALKKLKKTKLDTRSEKILKIFEEGLKERNKQKIENLFKPPSMKLLPEGKPGQTGGTIDLPPARQTGSGIRPQSEAKVPVGEEVQFRPGQKALPKKATTGKQEPIVTPFTEIEPQAKKVGQAEVIDRETFETIRRRGLAPKRIEELNTQIDKRIENFRQDADMMAQREGAGTRLRNVEDAVGGLQFQAKDFSLARAKKRMKKRAGETREEAEKLLYENDPEFKELVDERDGLQELIGSQAYKDPEIPENLFGAVAGVEPEFDEEGNIIGIKFDPVKAGIGLGLMSGTTKLKGATDDLAKQAKKAIAEGKSVDEFIESVDKQSAFHGTKEDFNKFLEQENVYGKRATFFAEDIEYAKKYGDKVKQVYIGDKKVLDGKTPQGKKDLQKIMDKINNSDLSLNRLDLFEGLPLWDNAPNLWIKEAKKLGYDGVKFTEANLFGGLTDTSISFGDASKLQIVTKQQLTDIWDKVQKTKP